MSPLARMALRCALTGAFTANGILIAALPGISANDLTYAALTGLGSALAYAGIGAAVPQVEPHVGNKLESEA